MKSLLRLIPLVVLIVMMAPWFAAAPTVVAADAITVTNTSAESNFPSGVTFNLAATSESPIVEADLFYRQAEQETLNMVSAEFETGTEITASLPLDFQNNYIPPGIELTYHWRINNEAGESIETPDETITWEDTRFDWQTLSTDQVTVYFYNDDEAFSQTILDSAQSTIDRLQADFNVERMRPIRIWVYNSKSDFQGSQAPNSQEWIAGTAYPELQVILAVLPKGDDREVGRVVPHEISHQVLYQATRNPFNAPPTWFDEGMAVSAQANGNENFQAMVERASDDGRLFSVRSLTSEFPYDPADASLAYAESYSIVQFMIRTWGNEGIAAIIAAYSQGLSHDDVLLQAIGVDMDELDRLWKEDLGYQGNDGVAGGVKTRTDSWTDQLLFNGMSILLALAIMVSGAVLLIRSRRMRYEDDDDDPAVLQFAWREAHSINGNRH